MTKSLHTAGYKRFCAVMIAERKRANLTQLQLAQRLGKHQSFVAKYERGERRLDVIEFLEITAAIGCKPAVLLRRLKQRPRSGQ